jgi:hypothetical protein
VSDRLLMNEFIDVAAVHASVSVRMTTDFKNFESQSNCLLCRSILFPKTLYYTRRLIRVLLTLILKRPTPMTARSKA